MTILEIGTFVLFLCIGYGVQRAAMHAITNRGIRVASRTMLIVPFLVTSILLLFQFRFGITYTFWVYLPFIIILTVASTVDCITLTLPNSLMYMGIILAPCASVLLGMALWDVFLGMSVAFLFFCLLYQGTLWIGKKEGLGKGDIKLMTLLGGLCGIKGILPVLYVAVPAAFLYGLLCLLHTKESHNTAIPFGPFLCFGALVYILFPLKMDTIFYEILK